MESTKIISISLLLHLISTPIASTPPLASTGPFHLHPPKEDEREADTGGIEAEVNLRNVTRVDERVDGGAKSLVRVLDKEDVEGVQEEEMRVPPSLFSTNTFSSSTCSTLTCLWFTSWQFLALCSIMLAWLLTLTTLLFITNTTFGRNILERVTKCCTEGETNHDEETRGIGYIDGSPGMRRFVLIEEEEEDDSESVSEDAEGLDKDRDGSWRLDKGSGRSDNGGKGWKRAPRKGKYVVHDTKNDIIVEVGTYRMQNGNTKDGEEGVNDIKYLSEGPTYILKSEKIDMEKRERDKIDKIEELRKKQEPMKGGNGREERDGKEMDVEVIRDIRSLFSMMEGRNGREMEEKGEMGSFRGIVEGIDDIEVEIITDLRGLYRNGGREIENSDGKNMLYDFLKYQIDLENGKKGELRQIRGSRERHRKGTLKVKEGRRLKRLVTRNTRKKDNRDRNESKRKNNLMAGEEVSGIRRLSLRPIEEDKAVGGKEDWELSEEERRRETNEGQGIMNERRYVEKEGIWGRADKGREIKENERTGVCKFAERQDDVEIEEGKGVRRKIRRKMKAKATEIRKRELHYGEKYVGPKMEEGSGRRGQGSDGGQVKSVFQPKKSASFPMDNYNPLYLLPRKLSLILEEEIH